MKYYNKNEDKFIYNNYYINENGTYFLDSLSKEQLKILGIFKVEEKEYNPEYQILEYKLEKDIYVGKPKNFRNKDEYIKEKIVKEFTERCQAILDQEAQKHGYDSIISACSYACFIEDNDFYEEGLKFAKWRSACWKWGYGLLYKYDPKNPETQDIETLIKGMPKFKDF